MIRYEKKKGDEVVMVGNVKKEGKIEGKRVVEKMVDGVIYFEGEGGKNYRIMRKVKKRLGKKEEIGVFEM